MYVPCSVWTVAKTNRGTAVLLKNEETRRSLPLFVGSAEAQVLLVQMERGRKRAPSLPGYVSELFRRGNITPKRIEIRPKGDSDRRIKTAFLRAGRMGEDDFTAELPLCETLVLSLSENIPVFVEGDYFELKAIYLNLTEWERRGKKQKLEEKLSRLVEREEYEEAALVRDRLQEMSLDPHRERERTDL